MPAAREGVLLKISNQTRPLLIISISSLGAGFRLSLLIDFLGDPNAVGFPGTKQLSGSYHLSMRRVVLKSTVCRRKCTRQ